MSKITALTLGNGKAVHAINDASGRSYCGKSIDMDTDNVVTDDVTCKSCFKKLPLDIEPTTERASLVVDSGMTAGARIKSARVIDVWYREDGTPKAKCDQGKRYCVQGETEAGQRFAKMFATKREANKFAKLNEHVAA